MRQYLKSVHYANDSERCDNRPSMSNVCMGHYRLFTRYCRGGPVPDRLSAALISRKFAVARACVRGPSRQADVSAAG